MWAHGAAAAAILLPPWWPLIQCSPWRQLQVVRELLPLEIVLLHSCHVSATNFSLPCLTFSSSPTGGARAAATGDPAAPAASIVLLISVAYSSTVNLQVVHELLPLEILLLLLESPSDDSVEVAVDFVKEVRTRAPRTVAASVRFARPRRCSQIILHW